MNAKTWVEIDSANLVSNLKQFRALLKPDTQLMSVIKANAYGHGLLTVADIIKDKVDWIGVDSIDEAVTLRGHKINNHILILGYTLNHRLEELLNYDIAQTVYNPETIKILGNLNKPSRIHLKVETGTSRQGVLESDLDEIIKLIQKYPQIKLEGVSTHFANIEDTTDHHYAETQLQKYQNILKILNDQKIEVQFKHLACTAATILFPETHGNLARIGIGQYGLWPSSETKVSAQQISLKLELKPVLAWKTIVAQVKTISKGTPVSYGCTEKVNRDSKIAVIPVGYWDGFDRKLSSLGNVLISGRRAKVLGRVCMNMIVVDATDIPDVQNESEVVIIGKQGTEEISADEVARKIGTINYEVVTRINPLIPRISV